MGLFSKKVSYVNWDDFYRETSELKFALTLSGKHYQDKPVDERLNALEAAVAALKKQCGVM